MIGGINMVVAFTGYRPEKMPFVESKKDEAYLKFRKRQLQVIERLIERGCTHFISGVAMGFDTWVAEDILALDLFPFFWRVQVISIFYKRFDQLPRQSPTEDCAGFRIHKSTFIEV